MKTKLLPLVMADLKQISRQKLFVSLVFFFLLYLGFCLFLSQLSLASYSKVLRDMSLLGLELSLVVLVSFGLSFELKKEKAGHILEIYLLNLSRSEYLAVKIGGYILAAGLYLSMAAVFLSLLLLFMHAFSWALFSAWYGIFLKIVLVVGMSALFSSVFSSPLLSASATIFVYLASNLLPLAITTCQNSRSYEIVLKILYVLFPNFSQIDFNYLAAWKIAPTFAQLAEAGIYSLAYFLCLYLLNIFIFEREEF